MSDRELTIREVIQMQKQRLRSDIPKVRMLESFRHSGDVGARLTSLSDRQIGQLMFDHVGDDFVFGCPQAAICNEATERLFRSLAGARSSHEKFNELGSLPVCPECGEDMLHQVGIDEPDYRECVSLTCGYKCPEEKR